jgi:hypothetical protein
VRLDTSTLPPLLVSRRCEESGPAAFDLGPLLVSLVVFFPSGSISPDVASLAVKSVIGVLLVTVTISRLESLLTPFDLEEGRSLLDSDVVLSLSPGVPVILFCMTFVLMAMFG